MPVFRSNDCSFKDRDLSDSSFPEHSIFVKPLPIDIQQEDLRFLFSPCGPIDRITIPKQYKDSYYSFAFIRFFKEESIQKAQKYYDGKMLGLKRIQVKDAKVRDHSKMTKYQKYLPERFETETVYDDGSQRHYSKPHKKIHSNEEVSKQSSNNDSYRRNLSRRDKLKNQTDEKFQRKDYENGYKKEKKEHQNRWKNQYHEPYVTSTQLKKQTMKEQNKFTKRSDTKLNEQKDKFQKVNTKEQNNIEY